jgi:hypothetical protein
MKALEPFFNVLLHNWPGARLFAWDLRPAQDLRFAAEVIVDRTNATYPRIE